MIKKCVYCGKEFNARQASRKFCSIPCRDNNRKKPLTLKCQNCGKEYTINKCKKRRKYCSLKYGYEIVDINQEKLIEKKEKI